MIEKLPDGNNNLSDFKEFKDVGFIVTDLDGTLVLGSEHVLMQIKKDINILRRDKVQITIATGRTYFGARLLMKEIGLPVGVPVALYNGSIVIEYGTDKLLYSNPIERKILEEFWNIITLLNSDIYIYTFDLSKSLLMMENESMIIEKVYGIGDRQQSKDVNGLDIKWIDDIQTIDGTIISLLIVKKFLNEDEIRKIKKFLDSSNMITYTDSGSGYIEIKSKGLDKAIIFQILKQREEYKENNKKILAIGDNDNDIDLFNNADISIAVGNSSPMAIDAAKYLCDNDGAKGFLDMLEVLKNAKKYYKDKE